MEGQLESAFPKRRGATHPGPAQVLNGTTTAIPVNAATNQLSSASYDSNGNMTSGVGATFTFDVGNRILSAAEISGGVEYHGYAPDNRRIYKKLTSGAEEYTFYGARGEKPGVYNLTGTTMSALRTNVWFGGKLISENSNAVFPDRVGTNRASGARFHPYGDEITSTANDREKFATYTRDSYTGLDYADQRYYASSYGRFNTPDPDGGSANPSKPGSWNRFAYVSGDPVNLRDGRGLEEDDCSLDYEEDGTIDQGCCLPTAYWSGGEEDFACSAGGGGGGGGGGGYVDPGSTAQMNNGFARGAVDFGLAYGSLINDTTALVFQLDGGVSPQCLSDFNAVGVTPAQEAGGLLAANIVNGFGTTLTYAMAAFGNTAAYQANVNVYGDLTVLQLFGTYSNTAAIAQASGNNIYIASNWINGMGQIDQEALLLHEVVHNITGNVDSVVQGQLGLSTAAASQNISDKLKMDCLQ